MNWTTPNNTIRTNWIFLLDWKKYRSGYKNTKRTAFSRLLIRCLLFNLIRPTLNILVTPKSLQRRPYLYSVEFTLQNKNGKVTIHFFVTQQLVNLLSVLLVVSTSDSTTTQNVHSRLQAIEYSPRY